MIHQLEHLPNEIIMNICSYHPLFIDYVRLYYLVTYTNGILSHKMGLNKTAFDRWLTKKHDRLLYEIQIFRYNPFTKTDRKKKFISHQLHRLVESNCSIN